MNLCGELICLNCGKVMQQGGTSIDHYGMSQFRFCECGLKVFLFTSSEDVECYLATKRKEAV